MADTLYEHYTTEFANNWMARVQQSKARLDPWVEEITFSGERKRFDLIGAMSSSKRTQRKAATNAKDPEYSMRWASNDSYELPTIFDKDDARKLGQLVLPQSDVIAAHAKAYMRDKDDVAWMAALDSAVYGETGTSTVALPNSQKMRVGGAWADSGGSDGTAEGLTLNKLIEVNSRLVDGADLEDDENDMKLFVCTQKQLDDLLRTTEVKSADYNTVKALAEGKVDSFMGFKFKRIKRLRKTSTTRTCVAWVKGAIKRITGSIKHRITERADLSYALQIYSEWYLGAVRHQDELVIQVDCKE